MRKTFSFIAPKVKPERQIEAIKYEIKKYIARERRKTLPEKVDFWDFDCKIGLSVESSEKVHVADLNKAISKLFDEKHETFYLEILAKHGIRRKKVQPIT